MKKLKKTNSAASSEKKSNELPKQKNENTVKKNCGCGCMASKAN